MSHQLAIVDAGGTLLLDASARAEDVEVTWDEHGPRSCRFFYPCTLAEAFRLYDRPGLPWVVLHDGARALWRGRIDDPALRFNAQAGGLGVLALGPWRALTDLPYTALWSTTRVSRWEPVPTGVIDCIPDRYESDTNNRLYLAPRKQEVSGLAARGGLTTETPYLAGTRQFVTISFNYTLVAPTGWRAQLAGWTRTYGSGVEYWVLDGNGTTQTGSQTITALNRDRLTFRLFFSGANTTYTGETGALYLRITNLRITSTSGSTVTADAIAGHLLTSVRATNPDQLDATTALIQATGLDLRDEVYEDASMATILDRLARIGDAQGRRWEVGVDEDRRLFLRPQGSAGRTWYVDEGELEVARSLEELANSAYAVYQNASNMTLRSDVASDAASVARWGLTRRQAIAARTTSLSQAERQRDTALADRKAPPARGQAVPLRTVTDATGARVPASVVRPGDTIVQRWLSPTLSGELDRIRSFRVSEVAWRLDDDTVTITPELPLHQLDHLLLRREAGV